MSVVIQGRDRPFGVFGAHTTRRRTFTSDDVHFLQAVAGATGKNPGETLNDEASMCLTFGMGWFLDARAA
jgi:hypothetical protein